MNPQYKEQVKKEIDKIIDVWLLFLVEESDRDIYKR